MTKNQDEKTKKEQMFDSYIKQCLHYSNLSINRNISRQQQSEVSLHILTENVLAKYALYDEYELHIFLVGDKEVVVIGDDLSEMLTCLSEVHRNILLLYYFSEYSDGQILEELDLPYVRRTVAKKRKQALNLLRQAFEKEMGNE